MSITAFKNSLIPRIKTFAGVPIIEADQTGDVPSGPHVTFKITTPYLKDRGQASETSETDAEHVTINRAESFKRVISFSAYDLDNDASFDLAQSIHDWFDFYGYDQLDALNMVVVEKTAVSNRDAFVIDGYERRNGFDVTLRLTRTLTQQYEYIERVDAFEPYPPTEYAHGVAIETIKAFAAEQKYRTSGPTEYVGQTFNYL